MDTLLNWLWQGCVVAGATAAILRILRPLRATERYYIWWAALLLVTMLPLMSASSMSPATPLAGTGLDRVLPAVSVPDTPWASSSTAVLLWLIWVAVCTARIAIALCALRRAQTRSRQIPAAVEARLPHWGRLKEQGRRARLVTSDGVRWAAVFGLGSPRIALAPALLEHLQDDDLDRVVVHEWAHVQRRDDLGNLIQQLVRVMVGWHPAVWWIDRHLHLEREVACDDAAVRITGSPKAYAAALANLASLPLARVAPLPVPGALSSSGIGRRIPRILASRTSTSPAGILVAAIAAVLSMSAIAWSAAGCALVQGAVPGVAAEDAGRARETVVGLGSSRAASEVVAEHVDGGAAPQVAARGTPSPARRRSPVVRMPVRQADESASVAIAPAESPAVDLLALPAVALRVRAEQAWPPFAPVPTGPPPRASAAAPPRIEDDGSSSPWSAAADAGAAVGRGSRNAAMATAGFFSRFGRKIAGSF